MIGPVSLALAPNISWPRSARGPQFPTKLQTFPPAMISALLRLAVAALALLAATAAPAAARALAATPKKAYTAKSVLGSWVGTAKGPIPVPGTAVVCDSVNYKSTYTATTFSVRAAAARPPRGRPPPPKLKPPEAHLRPPPTPPPPTTFRRRSSASSARSRCR